MIAAVYRPLQEGAPHKIRLTGSSATSEFRFSLNLIHHEYIFHLLAADREHLLESDLSFSLERDEILYHLSAPKQKCSSDYARWRAEDVEAAIWENAVWEGG